MQVLTNILQSLPQNSRTTLAIILARHGRTEQARMVRIVRSLVRAECFFSNLRNV